MNILRTFYNVENTFQIMNEKRNHCPIIVFSTTTLFRDTSWFSIGTSCTNCSRRARPIKYGSRPKFAWNHRFYWFNHLHLVLLYYESLWKHINEICSLRTLTQVVSPFFRNNNWHLLILSEFPTVIEFLLSPIRRNLDLLDRLLVDGRN